MPLPFPVPSCHIISDINPIWLDISDTFRELLLSGICMCTDNSFSISAIMFTKWNPEKLTCIHYSSFFICMLLHDCIKLHAKWHAKVEMWWLLLRANFQSLHSWPSKAESPMQLEVKKRGLKGGCSWKHMASMILYIQWLYWCLCAAEWVLSCDSQATSPDRPVSRSRARTHVGQAQLSDQNQSHFKGRAS